MSLINHLERLFFYLNESNPIPLQFIYNSLKVADFLYHNFAIDDVSVFSLFLTSE